MRTNLVRFVIAVALLLAAGVGRASAQGAAPAPPPSKFLISTSAYHEGSLIPTQYTCAVPKAISPDFSWNFEPAATVTLAAIFHDLEGAPAKGSMDTTHWILWNIPASIHAVPEGVQADAAPNGIVQGKNAANVNGYRPPCPPPNAADHHYVLELFALDAKLDLPAGSTRADLLKAMDGHVIGKAAYVGIYARSH